VKLLNTQKMPVKVYHNTRCKKSRAGLEHLQTKIDDFEVIQYLKDGITEEELKEIVLKLNISPFDLVRTQQDY
jgi:arsenate reductase